MATTVIERTAVPPRRIVEPPRHRRLTGTSRSGKEAVTWPVNLSLRCVVTPSTRTVTFLLRDKVVAVALTTAVGKRAAIVLSRAPVEAKEVGDAWTRVSRKTADVCGKEPETAYVQIFNSLAYCWNAICQHSGIARIPEWGWGEHAHQRFLALKRLKIRVHRQIKPCPLELLKLLYVSVRY